MLITIQQPLHDTKNLQLGLECALTSLVFNERVHCVIIATPDTNKSKRLNTLPSSLTKLIEEHAISGSLQIFIKPSKGCTQSQLQEETSAISKLINTPETNILTIDEAKFLKLIHK